MVPVMAFSTIGNNLKKLLISVEKQSFSIFVSFFISFQNLKQQKAGMLYSARENFAYLDNFLDNLNLCCKAIKSVINS